MNFQMHQNLRCSHSSQLIAQKREGIIGLSAEEGAGEIDFAGFINEGYCTFLIQITFLTMYID